MELRKQILWALWILGNLECLHSVLDRFDVCKLTAHQVYRRVCYHNSSDTRLFKVLDWSESSRSGRISKEDGYSGCFGGH